MTHIPLPHATLAICMLLTGVCPAREGAVALSIDGKALVHYQAHPVQNPKGGGRFKGSNFIHPLKTPSGFVLTQIRPLDHRHHFGLWWPWKYVATEGRKVLFWELQKGDGIVQAQGASRTEDGLAATSVYLDRKAPGGPRILLTETVRIEGATENGGSAGTILMSHPANHAHPEQLRTWDRQHGGAVFVNFNTVQEASWTLDPGTTYARHYRLFVYDGAVSTAQAEGLWKA